MLTFDRRIAFIYPSGSQTLHANFHADNTGFYFASGGQVRAFNTNGRRNAGGDLTLQNLPVGQTIWGFTAMPDGGWAVLTRETSTGVVGMVRVFERNGTEELNFPVQSTIPTVSGESFRAPKALIYSGGNYFVRVVRSVGGNMRFVSFDANGAPTNRDILVSESNPTALSDATASRGHIFIIQQNQRIAYATNMDFEINAELQTPLEARNTAPWAASAHEGTLYVADRGGFIYAYTGIPAPPPPSTGGSGGSGFTIFQAMLTNAIMSRNLNRRERR